MGTVSKSQYINIIEEVINIIHSAKREDDLFHSYNVVCFLKLLGGDDISNVMKIAGFANDIERAIKGDAVKPENYEDYEAYKIASSDNSATTISRIMKRFGVSEENITEVANLIRGHHSKSDDHDIQMLCDADALSFFYAYLPSHRDASENVLYARCKLEYSRMSPKAQEVLKEMKIFYSCRKLNNIMKDLIGIDVYDSISDNSKYNPNKIEIDKRFSHISFKVAESQALL